jgi:tetratricopeptide (TPR) repeat protein
MRRGTLLLLAALILLGGCRHEALRARYLAERARYWAERNEIRFSLEVDPRIRARHYQTGLRYLEVAQLSDPRPVAASADARVLEDLLRMHSQARLRAGGAFLEAGRFDLAEDQLAWVQGQGRGIDRLRAAWLRAGAAWGQEEWSRALDRYEEVYALQPLLETTPPEPDILIEVVDRAFELAAAGRRDLLGRCVDFGKTYFDLVQERWPGTPEAARAAFLAHRLDVAAEDWAAALSDLDRYEARDLSEADHWNAVFNRAEIHLGGTGRLDRADSLYAAVAAQQVAPGLAALARLRRVEILLERRGIEAALARLGELEEELHPFPRLAAAALMRQSDLRARQGDLVGANQSLRRLRLRYPDTPAGLEAPRLLVELAERSGDPGALENALGRAAVEYRRQLAGHAVDGPVGLAARRALVETLLRQGETEEALLELEQLYHVLGDTPSGARALLRAAQVAVEEAGDAGLARRYLVRVAEEVPATREGLRARRMLEELGSTIDSPGVEP